MKRLFEGPFRWRDQKLGVKLSLGFGVLIAVFSILGIMALLNMRAIQKQTRTMGEDHIPMVSITYNMEHFTHEAMHAMLGYSLSEEDHYYKTAREHILRIEQYYAKVDSMINHSPSLFKFEVSGSRIGRKLSEFKHHTEEMALITQRIRQVRDDMEVTYTRFSALTQRMLIRNNLDFREKLIDRGTTVDELIALHRISKMINLIIDKGNISRIEVLNALARKDPQLIENVNARQYQYLYTIVSEMKSLSEPEYIELLDNILGTVKTYQGYLMTLSGYIDETKKLEQKIEESAFSALYESHMISAEINKITGQTSMATIQLLESSTTFLIGGLVLSFLIAIFFSVKTTQSITQPLRESLSFAQKVSSGDLNASVNIEQKDELGVLAETLREMLHRLRDNLSLLQRTERKMMNIMLETEQKERKRFAEDLHDSLGPLLSTIKLYLNSITSSRHDQSQSSIMLRNANEVIDEAIQSVKTIANNLMPRLLEDFGLEVALRSFLKHVRHANALEVQFECDNYSKIQDPHKESMIYNTILELTNNTIRHAKASRIKLHMKQNDDICTLEYIDDGIGCNLDEVLERKPYSLGLRNITSRIQSINGKIEFHSERNNGFLVKIQV